MIATATVGAIRNIGRPVDRQALAPVCPERVAYFGWPGGAPGSVQEAVRRAQVPGPCCPPTMVQRNALQAAHVPVAICCAGTSWAVLPSSTSPAMGDAVAWLAAVEPGKRSDCTTVHVAGIQLPDDVNRLAQLNRDRGPSPIVRAGYARGTFRRAPVSFGGPNGYCPSMCIIGGVNVVKWNKCGVPDPPKACLPQKTPTQFAETSWCADYAASHGPLGVRGCANAAMGLGKPSPIVGKPPDTYPICKTGKDCAG
jgi:hypothetical protein